MTDAAAGLWRAGKGGVSLRVRVTPKAGSDAVDGLCDTPAGPALKVRVRAIADKGEANASVEKVVAAWLGLPRTHVAVAAGGKSRVKSLQIDGDAAALGALVEGCVGKLAKS